MLRQRLTRLLVAGAALGLSATLFATSSRRLEVLSQWWSLNGLHYSEFTQKVRARLLPPADDRFAALAQERELLPPRAMVPSGFYPGPVDVQLVSDTAASTIRYTLDGSTPTPQSLRYTRSLQIGGTTVLRFRSFARGWLPSPTLTQTYFVATSMRLPVVSLVAEPVHLWNKYSGIYANPLKRGQKWERPTEVEFYRDAESPPIRFAAALRIHGETSRSYPKKSFRLRYQLGDVVGRDAGNFLTSRGSDAERTVILRAGGTNVTYRVRDELIQLLHAELGGLSTAFVPVMVFVNGQVWGIYNLQERPDLEFVRRHIGPGEYDLIADQGIGDHAVAGDLDAWRELIRWFNEHELVSDTMLAEAGQRLDVDSFLNYWLLNIYAANMDWPHTNTFAFRPRDGGRWRWISWDGDATFDKSGQGLTHDTLAWASRSALRHDLRFNAYKGPRDRESHLVSTLILRRLLANRTFQSQFLTRMDNLLNTQLAAAVVEARLDSLLATSRHDLPKDWARWEITEQDYMAEVARIREFIRLRPSILREHVRNAFALGPDVQIRVSVEPAGAGDVQINGVPASRDSWTGRYFAGTLVTLAAKAADGYAFAGWSEPSVGRAASASIVLKRDVALRAIFRPLRGTPHPRSRTTSRASSASSTPSR